MKVGIVGIGGVGAACLMALIMRNCVHEIVLIDKDEKRAKAVATDLQYGAPLSSHIIIRAGNYQDLADSHLVMITAGINEKTGGATDRSDPRGRLKLLKTNADIYKDIVPQIVKAAPKAILLVVTDPPDPLADIARQLAKHDRVLSTGTFLDSLRFRFHLAQHFNVNPLSVDAFVLGEHGVSQVFLWSSVRIGGQPLHELLNKKQDIKTFQQQIENEVRYANITIIEGNNASQYGIGMVTARIVEIILRDEQIVIPIGSHNSEYNVTFSLPSIVGCKGISKVFNPEMSAEEKQKLQKSAEILRQTVKDVG